MVVFETCSRCGNKSKYMHTLNIRKSYGFGFLNKTIYDKPICESCENELKTYLETKTVAPKYTVQCDKCGDQINRTSIKNDSDWFVVAGHVEGDRWTCTVIDAEICAKCKDDLLKWLKKEQTEIRTMIACNKCGNEIKADESGVLNGKIDYNMIGQLAIIDLCPKCARKFIEWCDTEEQNGMVMKRRSIFNCNKCGSEMEYIYFKEAPGLGSNVCHKCGWTDPGRDINDNLIMDLMKNR